MTNQKTLKRFAFMPAMVIMILSSPAAAAPANVLSLKTDQLDEIIDISAFLRNSRGEVFLFSGDRGKIFKFKPDGTFEICRVFSMFHNPVNDFLYLRRLLLLTQK